MNAKQQLPERRRFQCKQDPEDAIILTGPDEDGDLDLQLEVADPVNDGVCFSAEEARRLRDYLNRFLKKVGAE